ncbi:hypothetical protein L210DRAFT_3558068 [Boletus edulis BED1]|uniref:Uncharacterized protein n=1 Tax=Boletus edulis BED1 TaxID=1328754 RepID=A0AAD4BK35_BOLED|nr:hypothetical protein L210DRAFT_3558068 [Boletus edulis BED1]
MSPIPTTFALCTPAPSVTLDPTGQGTPLMSQFLLGTGSFLVAVVALVLVSVARYFYHGRGTVDHTRTGNTWIPWTGLLPSIRRRGSPTTSKAAAMDWPADVEAGYELDVRIVYVRFSHPAIWNIVECHPGTPSVPDLSPSGVDSFLDMVDRVGRHGVKEVPLYDTISPTSVSSSSEIIGTTVRQGTSPSVLGELEDDLSETSPSDPELDFPGSPYDEILTIDSEPDFACSPHDGNSTVNSEPDLSYSPHDGMSTTDSESQFSCSPYDGIVMTTPISSSGACVRRHGVVDMTHLAQNLKDTISEEGYPLVPVIPCRAGLIDLPSFADMDPTPPCGSLQELDPADEESTANYDNGVHDTHEALVDGSIDVDIPEAPHSGGDLMRLCDPDLDCTPRSPSEDSDDDEEGAITGSPCRHQLWAPIFRCRSRDMSTLAKTTVRYSMVRRCFWRAEIAVSHHPLRSSHSSLIVVSVLSRLEILRRSYRTTRVDSTLLRRHLRTRSNRRRSKLAHPDPNLALLSLFPAPSHPLPRCLLSFYAHLDVAGNLNCVC